MEGKTQRALTGEVGRGRGGDGAAEAKKVDASAT